MAQNNRLLKYITPLLTLFTSTTIACDVPSPQFQSEVLEFLKKEYPEQKFALDKNVDVIRMGEVELGLQNLRSKICQSNQPLAKSSRREVLRSHFSAMLKLLEAGERQPPDTWSQAKERIYPQLMPSEYLSESIGTGKAIVSRPFIPGIELAIVLDVKDGYSYVREDNRVQWKVSKEELFETALRNLDEQKSNVKLQGSGDPERFLAFEEKDGYDAVRLLIPWVRQEAAKFLGEPFLVLIPNRDFLIMWSEKNSAGFQNFAKAKGAEDFKNQPYPLSPHALRVWENGNIEILK